MNRIYRALFLSLFLVVPLWAQTPVVTPVTTPLTVTDTDKPIRVDGYLVDWPKTRMILLNKKSQVTYGLLNWKSSDDFSGRIFLTYDSQYLYLSAIVQKPSGVVNDNKDMALWDGDCIELFLSAGAADKHPNHITKGDYHIAFSPGTGCRNPQIYCFNKETRIGGGRVSARPSLNGYILEACVPLTFFEGLEIGPDKTILFDLALDEGGSSTGNRMLQLSLSGNPDNWKNPSLWAKIQWAGKTVVSVPTNDEENLYADLVTDGTKTSTFWGRRTLTGSVVDAQGQPLAGARVTTWPRTLSAVTDKDGQFELDQVKVYDRTVVYAGLDGYGASLSPVERESNSVTVRLTQLPMFLSGDDDMRSGFYGQSVQVPLSGDLSSMLDRAQDWSRSLPVDFLKLVGTDHLNGDEDQAEGDLDKFVAYARAQGAEPMIELPIRRADPETVAEWVRHCNVEKGEKVLYWTIGDEPDLYAEKSKDPNFAAYNVYDYINDFRTIYNAVKRVDPSVLILGPELAWRYTSGEDDWFTPFIQFDGDIVNLASIHHYAAITAAQCTPDKVVNDVRHIQTLTRGLEDRLAINSDFLIPLVLTGGNICLESTDNTRTAQLSQTPAPTASSTPISPAGTKVVGKPTPTEDSGPRSFWAAIWQAEEVGALLNNRMPMAFSSYLVGNGALDFFDDKGARPDYWALRLLSGSMKGKSVWAQVQNSNVSVYAVQDPKTKDVVLLLINRGSNYYHPKILLNAKDCDVSVDAGLDLTFDFELPYYSIAVLQLKADRSPGTAYLFTKKMAQAGKPAEMSVIKPW